MRYLKSYQRPKNIDEVLLGNKELKKEYEEFVSFEAYKNPTQSKFANRLLTNHLPNTTKPITIQIVILESS